MNITDDFDSVIKVIKKDRPKVVGIDGIDGVGKTPFAKDIEKLGYKRISLDDYRLFNLSRPTTTYPLQEFLGFFLKIRPLK